MSILQKMALGSAVVVATLAPAGARAQLGGSVVFTPYIGVYAPANDLGRALIAGPGGSAEAWMKHRSAAAFGTNASYWMNDHFGLEGGLVYSNTRLSESMSSMLSGIPSSQSTLEHANVWLASTKLMVQVFPAESDFNLRFGFGPALITRNGSAYTENVGKDVGLTDVGAALSLCSRLNLSPKYGIRIRAEDYMYRAKIGYENPANPSENFSFGAKTQHDFVLSAGFQVFLNR